MLTYEGEVPYGEMMWNTNIGYRNVWGYTPADARKLTKLPEGRGMFGGNQTVAVYGSARVGFNPDRLWEPGEEYSEAS